MRTLAPFETWPIKNGQLETLYKQVEAGAVPHALLFVGHVSEGAKLAKFLAKTLLCRGPLAPCEQCDACLQFDAGTHPDFREVNDEQTTSVKTGQIEELQSHLTLRTHGGGRMVYLIHGIDTATGIAANRLLKTLEEPAQAVIALLTATSRERILPTILSRCFTYRLDDSADKMLWDDQFEIVSHRLAEGEIPEFASILGAMIKWTETMLSGQVPVLLLADAFLKDCADIDLAQALKLFAVWLRDIMHHHTGLLNYIRFPEYTDELNKQSKMVSVPQLAQMIDIALHAGRRTYANVSPQLNIEQMCIRLREVTRGVQRSRSPLQTSGENLLL